MLSVASALPFTVPRLAGPNVQVKVGGGTACRSFDSTQFQDRALGSHR
jgi:hypothetical protein